MAVELVDGYAGRAHIDSGDLAVLNQGTFGVESGVFDVQDKFACTMETANKAVVGTGAGLVKGLRFRIDRPESLTITSGTQSKKRNDLIVARYAKETSTGIESVSLVVIKGTSDTTPVDPAVQPGDLKLWRIPLDGISVGKPVALFDPLASVSSLRTATKPGVWVNVWTGGDGQHIKYIKTGRIVTIVWVIKFGNISEWKLDKLPADMLPLAQNIHAACAMVTDGDATSNNTAMATLYTSGVLAFKTAAKVPNVWLEGSMTYVAAQ